MDHVLKTEAMRVVEKNEKGIVTYRKRYKRGDLVDVSHIEEAQVERLLASGALALVDPDAPAEAEEESEGQSTPDGSEGQGDGTEGSNEPDVYDDMDYATLQQEAKNRGLNAGGSAEDLRGRLREDDESSDDDE